MKKLLATILALVMALGLCSVSWAEGTTQSTLQSRINAAGNTETTVALTGNVTESITVGSGQSIILDLKGYTLTNAAGSHTITNNGTLTIKDSSERKTGTVDNVTHARAAIYNNGTMTLEGGSYTRSAEKSNEPNRNSWYVIYNKGELTTYDGVVVKFSDTDRGTFSSLFVTTGSEAKTTIDGGKFISGLIALKVEGGTLDFNGGDVTGDNQAVQCWATVNISGGDLTGDVCAWSYTENGSSLAGKITISGDTTINGDVKAIQWNYNNTPAATPATIEIKGGDVFGDALTATKDYGGSAASVTAKMEITGGTFKNDVSAYVQAGEEAKTIPIAKVKYASGTEFYAVGDYVSLEGEYADSGDTLTITQGNADLTNVPAGVIVNNTGDGKVTVNGTKEVKKGDAPYTVPTKNTGGYYYYHPTTDTKTDTTTKGSPKTFDAGVGIYAVTALLSVTGMAWTAKKRH